MYAALDPLSVPGVARLLHLTNLRKAQPQMLLRPQMLLTVDAAAATVQTFTAVKGLGRAAGCGPDLPGVVQVKW
jgi:hypothetical protein